MKAEWCLFRLCPLLPDGTQLSCERTQSELSHAAIGNPHVRSKLDILMSKRQHQDVRTTLTIDEDVAAKLKAESRKTGRSFKETVNACLRVGLSLGKPRKSIPAFHVRPQDMGLQPGVSLDKISTLLDEIEGPSHR